MIMDLAKYGRGEVPAFTLSPTTLAGMMFSDSVG